MARVLQLDLLDADFLNERDDLTRRLDHSIRPASGEKNHSHAFLYNSDRSLGIHFDRGWNNLMDSGPLGVINCLSKKGLQF